MSDYTPSDVLRKAAERIVEPGMWYQGAALWYQRDQHGRVSGCAYGHVRGVAEDIDDGWGSELTEKATTLLYDAVGGPVTAWNDAPGRTPEEVAAVMLAAADRADRITDG